MNRVKKLVAALPEGVDAILVTNTRNQLWVSGYDFEDGFLFITKKKSYLLTDGRYIESAQDAAPADLEVTLMKGPRKDMFQNLCDENGVKTVYFEDTWVSYATYQNYLKLFEGKDLQPAGKLIENLREFKDPDEVENIVKAQRIAEKAFDHILGFITPDRTEAEVALELEFYMRSLGAEGLAFPTIAVSGKASALPHGTPRNCKLEKGFFTLDYGAKFNGYCSDMTRTIVIGKADDEIKYLYNTVLSAQLAAIEALRDGVTGAELDRAARDIIDATKYKGLFTHSLGHGVGMYIHEAPGVSAGNNNPLKTGHVITLEPGIYVAGTHGCRIEDMAYFSENGPVLLTNCPKNLIEL